jgi:hypothetical protein
MGYIDAAVRHLYPGDIVFFHQSEEIVELVADDVGFEEEAAEVDGDACVLEELYFFVEACGEEGGSEGQFYKVNMGVGAGDEVTGFADAEAFVVDHREAVCPWSAGTFRDLREVEIHACKLGCRSETGKKG